MVRAWVDDMTKPQVDQTGASTANASDLPRELLVGLFFELLSMAIALAVRLVVLGIQLVVQLLRINWRILVAGMTVRVF